MCSRLLEDHFAGPEVATPVRADRFLAEIDRAMLEHAGAAFGAGSETFLPAEVGCVLIIVFASLAEIEFDSKLVGQPHARSKWPAHAAAKARQRTDKTAAD
jgi:hypothetical protein